MKETIEVILLNQNVLKPDPLNLAEGLLAAGIYPPSSWLLCSVCCWSKFTYGVHTSEFHEAIHGYFCTVPPKDLLEVWVKYVCFRPYLELLSSEERENNRRAIQAQINTLNRNDIVRMASNTLWIPKDVLLWNHVNYELQKENEEIVVPNGLENSRACDRI